MFQRTVRVLLAASFCASALGACAGGATFRNGVFDDGVVRYRIGPVPAEFQRVEVENNDLAFHHPTHGTIGINATCTEYEDVPEQALVNHLLFGTSERRFRLEENATIDGRGARHVIVDLELDGVPVSLEIYLVRKDGCVYDLTYIAGQTAFDAGRPVFESFVRGFGVLSTRLPG